MGFGLSLLCLDMLIEITHDDFIGDVARFSGEESLPQMRASQKRLRICSNSCCILREDLPLALCTKSLT
jgi:hypothetical protein